MRVHLRAAEPLWRAVARTSEIVPRQVMRGGDGFRDAKVQQADRSIRTNLDVRWFNVAVYHGPLAPVDVDLERMQLLELAADLSGVACRPRGLDSFLYL